MELEEAETGIPTDARSVPAVLPVNDQYVVHAAAYHARIQFAQGERN